MTMVSLTMMGLIPVPAAARRAGSICDPRM